MIENDQDLSIVTGVIYWFWKGEYGRPFGSFYEALLNAVLVADSENRAKIAKEFPLLVQAVNIARAERDGREVLESAAKDYRARVRAQRATLPRSLCAW